MNHRRRRIHMLALVGVLLGSIAFGGRAARAEEFADPAFRRQWQQTDQAVADGKVSRTFFWGPRAFGHTKEVYAEGPEGGKRLVQYFDKARMELTRRAAQDPNQVTNGLLTVELVSGRLQVGDSMFLQREPASVIVAGDPLNNNKAPTYLSFNLGKLAYGVPGAAGAADRTGQVIREAVNRAGQVSTVEPPRQVSYARFFPQTGHNVADVFNTFFQQAPLGPDAWLPVMGLPISEPFWARDKVVVAGQPRDVLIQLFERRALTYTPSNPAGFQIEMGNIGQHYFLWRYNLDVRDRLPPNVRVLRAQDRALLSTSIRNPDNTVRLGDVNTANVRLWALPENRAVLWTSGLPQLVDLTQARPYRALPLPEVAGKAVVEQVFGSANGRRLVLRVHGEGESSAGGTLQGYELGTLDTDNLQIASAVTLYQGAGINPRLSRDGAYVALVNGRSVVIVDWATRQAKTVQISERAPITRLEWIGRSHRLLVSAGSFDTTADETGATVNTPGTVAVVDAASATTTTIVSGAGIREASASPDGNYFVLRSSTQPFFPEASSNGVPSRYSIRSFVNPQAELGRAYEQGTPGRNAYEPGIGDWSADGTYFVARSSAGLTAGSFVAEETIVSLVTGQPIERFRFEGGNYTSKALRLVAPYSVLLTSYIYNGPEARAEESIVVQNIDGSDKVTIHSARVTANVDAAGLPVRTAQAVQIVTP